MKRVLVFIVLIASLSKAEAQSPRERIAKLRDLLMATTRTDSENVQPNASSQAVDKRLTDGLDYKPGKNPLVGG